MSLADYNSALNQYNLQTANAGNSSLVTGIGGNYVGSGPWTATYPVAPDPYFPAQTALEPKYPGHQCDSYDEFRTFVLESDDVPEWVKQTLSKLDQADPWMAEMWAGILSRWQGRRVAEIKEAQRRLNK